MLSKVVFDSLNVEAFGIVDSGVVFDDGCDLGTILFKELGSPVSDSTETLNDKGTIFDTLGKATLVSEVLVAAEFADSVVDTETSRLVTSVDTTLGNELTSAAALSVDVLLTLNVHVGVLNPGHDLLVGTHVGTETVDGSTNETLLDELHGVFTSNSLKFGLGKLSGVNFDATLTTTEWDISDSEFESHEGSQSLNLLKIDVVGISSTTLAGELVSGVLGSVAGDSLKSTIVSSEGDVESDHSLARLN